MSDPKLISPMLDHFTMGDPISSHNGVTCYPAMRENSDDRYIVKIISLPASPVQRAALLLSGAYTTQEEVLHYYRTLATEIIQEVRAINELANLEGFVPYLDAQVAEKENGEGYDVYILSQYQNSLEQIFAEEELTHRGIMDLAMDICSALAACRRSGFLYTDLKPSNIFHSEEYGYRISDLGLLKLSSLKYASLPDKYISLYTAPEIADASSDLNTTLDVYALGLVLYQAYNGGVLPVEDGKVGPLLPPVYADYELSEIILRACHPDVQKRWQDPVALGQALGQYMQKNPVEDTPIIPLPVSTPELDAGEEFLPEEEEIREEELEAIAELAFFQEMEITVEDAEISQWDQLPAEDDTSDILAHADALIAHTLPDPVVAPEKIEIPMPEPVITEQPEAATAEEETTAENEEAADAAPAVIPPVLEETPAEPVSTPVVEGEVPQENKKKIKWILPLIVAVLLTALILGGMYYYRNMYLQTIDDLVIIGDETSVTVQIESEIADELLRVTCSDTYGNTMTGTVTDGSVTFNGLAPQTRYTIRVAIEGFHKLIGDTIDSYTTPNQTNILSFSASIGPVDGSVYLNFTVNGTESDEWIITYSADGIQEQSVSFAGHSITIYDLIIGADYTFTLTAGDTANVTGNTHVSFTAQTIIRALNPTITACGNGSLTVTWDTPEGETVSSWTIHCYDESGYEQTVTTSENSYTFTGLTHETACTVEILADGMNQGVTVSIGANPINITAFTYDINTLYGISLSWTFTGAEPTGEWILYWSCDGYSTGTITTPEENVYLPYIPNGNYTVTLACEDGSAVFNHSYIFTVDEAEMFSGFGITAQNLMFMMCATPNTEQWNWSDIQEDAYRTDFTAGEIPGFVVWSDTEPEAADTAQFQFVIRNEAGQVLDVSAEQAVWSEIWEQNYCELTLPFVPTEPGTYTIWVYCNNQYLTQQTFTVH